MAEPVPARLRESAGWSAPSPRWHSLVRPGLVLLAILFAIAALGSAIDRIIGEAPSASAAAGNVPGIFADASLRRAAAIELAAGRYAGAAQLARKATIASPLEPTSTGLLGAAWLAQGKAEQADQAFRISGQLGWRDSITQTYWMKLALLSGDLSIAGQRLDAILRREPTRASQPELLAPFEASAAGQTVLVQRLTENPGWLSAYFNPLAPINSRQLAQRAQVARLLADRHPIGCARIARFTQTLIAAGAIIPAHDVWQLHCPTANGQIITDPDFTHGFRSNTSPFGWQNSADGSINIRGGKGGLVIENSAPFPRHFARQLLVLPPGHYRLSWHAHEADDTQSNRIEASTGCTADTPTRIEAAPISGSRQSGILHFTGACEGQYLSFRIRPGPAGLGFGKVRLEPVAAGPAI